MISKIKRIFTFVVWVIWLCYTIVAIHISMVLGLLIGFITLPFIMSLVSGFVKAKEIIETKLAEFDDDINAVFESPEDANE